MARPARTVFLGSGAFGLPSLEWLARSPEVELVGIVTVPARPSGRRRQLRATPVAEAMAGAGLPVLAPPSLRDAATAGRLGALRPDLLVLADYGRLVPPALLALPAGGALNLHPSLLPRHRGASPIAATILSGDREAGVTLMRMDEGLDTGPIVAQARLALDGHEVAPELEARLADLAAGLLAESIPGWLEGRLPARPQPAQGATLTRPLRREDGRLDATRGAVELERQVRAFQPWPGSFVEHDGLRLIVWRATPVASEAGGADAAGTAAGSDAADTAGTAAGSDAADMAAGAPGDPIPGALTPLGDDLALVTGSGWLRLDEVQPGGGRRMSGAAYRRGRRA